MGGRSAHRMPTQQRVVAHPSGTTTNTDANTKEVTGKSRVKTSPDEVRSELADQMAAVLTGKKKLAPTPEALDKEAKVRRAWKEGYRGFEPREIKSQEERFAGPLLIVKIGGFGVGVEDGKGGIKRRYYGPGEVLIDRLDELCGYEGVTITAVPDAGRVTG